MPRVPRLSNQSVRTAPSPTPQTTADAEGLPFARLAAQVADVVDQERERVRKVQTQDALVKLRTARDRALYDPKKGALTRQMADAVDAPDVFRDQWGAEVSQIAAGIRDPEARRRFQQASEQERVEAESMVLRHVDGETERLDKVTTEQRAQQLLGDVVAFAGDADMANAKVAALATVLRERLDRQGLRGETADGMVAEAVSNARLAQVQALAANPATIEQAKEVLEANIEQIAPDQRQKTRDYVDAAGIVVQSQRIVADLFSAFGPDDERAALAEARTYEGKLGDEVVRRVEMRYADERRLKNQDIQERTTAALGDIEAGRPVSVETYTYLEQEAPQTLQALRTRQRQVANGTAPETDIDKFLEVWEILDSGDLRAITELDLTAYKPYLTDTAWAQAFRTRSQMVRSNNVAQNRPMTPARINEYAVQQMVGTGVLPGITRLSDIKRETAQYRTWTEMQPELTAAIETAQSEKDKQTGGNIPLTSAETQAAVRTITDDLVLRTAGIQRNRIVPRAAVEEGTAFRELTPEERAQTLGARDRARFEARATQLRQQGYTKEQARATLLAEGYTIPEE